jgi:hypothetical protein
MRISATVNSFVLWMGLVAAAAAAGEPSFDPRSY